MTDEPSPSSPKPTNRTPQSLSTDEITRASTPTRDNEDNETKHEHEHDKNVNIEAEETKEVAGLSSSHRNPSFPDGGWRACRPGALLNHRTPPLAGDVQHIFNVRLVSFHTHTHTPVPVYAASFNFGTLDGTAAGSGPALQHSASTNSQLPTDTFQAHYQQTILKDSPPSNMLFDIGYLRSILLTSSALLITATFLVAQCTQYWHFVLCQGIVIGFAAGGIFGPTTAVIGHWFHRRRGLAMGWVAVGSSLGGTLLPIAAKNLIAAVGFQWTMRIIGFILILTLGVANLTLKRRLPPVNVAGGLLNLHAFKYAPFTIYCFSAFFAFLGIYTVLTYVSVSALELGPANIIIPFTAAAGILTFSSGAYVSLLANPIMSLGVTDDLGRRIGMFMSIFALGALAGPPISGAINTASGGFEVVGYYAGNL
ncbi:hypothetical protein C0995_004512 [Termitomyces sp. Mi166|nr:hypothetical protein C0995_004512 [Termitomyces sp. Mi166\